MLICAKRALPTSKLLAKWRCFANYQPWGCEHLNFPHENKCERRQTRKPMSEAKRMVGSIRSAEHEFSVFQGHRLGSRTRSHRDAPYASRRGLWRRQNAE